MSGLTFLAAYIGAWKVIGLEDSDRVVLRQLWSGRRRKRQLPNDAAA